MQSVIVKKVAVLITCHNRKDKTIRALHDVYCQQLGPEISLHVFLVDDGSTDGTSSQVEKDFPSVTVLRGDGTLYWNGGMRKAWAFALESGGFDFFFLMNDDTALCKDAVSRLINVYQMLVTQGERPGIIVGSVTDSKTGELSYGGNRQHRMLLWKGYRFSRVQPTDRPVLCDTFNANCVLIPEAVVNDIGILDENFTHGMGDYDYGLRARGKGYPCWVAPGYLGQCDLNRTTEVWLDRALSLEERKKFQESPRGVPTSEWLFFVKRHSGVLWIIAWLQLRLKLYFPGLWQWLKMRCGEN